jgi:type IV pilus assembly protein PilN
MKVRLNLATNGLQTHRKFLAGSALIGVIAGAVFVALAWHVYTVRRADEAVRAKAAQVRQEITVLMSQRQKLENFFAEDQNARLHERSAFLNSLIDEQSLNWTQMFMDLEKILPTGVHLVSIEPKHEKGRVQVKLLVGAINDEAKLKFIRALEASPAFTHVEDVHEIMLTSTTSGRDRLQVELKVVYSRS